MKKLSTLYKKDPNDLGRVIDEINPENTWVFWPQDSGVKATRKYDGTACAIIDGFLHKRYDVKRGKAVPDGAIPCQEPDAITGHWPHWVLCDTDNPADKYHFEGLKELMGREAIKDGTYELCGPKVQGNPEGYCVHLLIEHGGVDLGLDLKDYSFIKFKNYLAEVGIEGIVFHHPDGRMCKLRKSDYGIKR